MCICSIYSVRHSARKLLKFAMPGNFRTLQNFPAKILASVEILFILANQLLVNQKVVCLSLPLIPLQNCTYERKSEQTPRLHQKYGPCRYEFPFISCTLFGSAFF